MDLEQRDGRIHWHKGHAVRRTVAASHADDAFASWRAGDDIWRLMFELANNAARDAEESVLIPHWTRAEPSTGRRASPLASTQHPRPPTARSVMHRDWASDAWPLLSTKSSSANRLVGTPRTSSIRSSSTAMRRQASRSGVAGDRCAGRCDGSSERTSTPSLSSRSRSRVTCAWAHAVGRRRGALVAPLRNVL